MGQHKTNPTAIKAKAGEIPPKKKVAVGNTTTLKNEMEAKEE